MTGVLGITMPQESRIKQNEREIDDALGKLIHGEINGDTFRDSMTRIVVVEDAIKQELASQSA
jgi:hypothetical protein